MKINKAATVQPDTRMCSDNIVFPANLKWEQKWFLIQNKNISNTVDPFLTFSVKGTSSELLITLPSN
jgi:hypothetical protein